MSRRPRATGFALRLAGLMALSAPAAAQQFLYEPSPPPGSAYVRFVNALATPATVAPDFLPPETRGTAAAERAGAYRAVEGVAGRTLAFDIAAQGKTAHGSLTVSPGSYVTVLLEPGSQGVQTAVLIDQTDFNQLRAHLSFVNAVPDCAQASLLLAASGQAVFADVPANTARSRSVNPVEAPLRASCGDAAAPDFALTGLEAGGMYSIWLMRPAGALEAFLTRDTTAPVRR